MKKSLGLKNVFVIPNGVNTEVFKPNDKLSCQILLGWDSTKTHILFASNPHRKEKNYLLLENAAILIDDISFELHSLNDVEHYDLPTWYNASDVIVLTSLWEGSPNVIKESMACSRPIVATDVGDISWVLGDINGCYLTDFDPEDLKKQLIFAINFSRNKSITEGRDRIMKLGLDSNSIAKKLIAIYSSNLYK